MHFFFNYVNNQVFHVNDLKRELVSVLCDGLTYTLVWKLINKTPDDYGWLLLRPGGGHIEMNMVRPYFSIVLGVVVLCELE